MAGKRNALMLTPCRARGPPPRVRGKRFNYVLSIDRRDAGVHFFICDYQFEQVWNDPYPYIERLREFPCALTPDFSLYLDMPMAMKIWNWKGILGQTLGQLCLGNITL